MASELEKIIAEDDKEKSKDASAEAEAKAKAEAEAKQTEKTEEELKREEQLVNLNKATEEANRELKSIRQQIKKAKKGELDDEEDDTPKINDEDPSAKAWNKRIQETVSPVQDELEKEKSEVRTFALREFLNDKPALAKNPEKVKQLITEYERLSSGQISERTKEGVSTYLNKAFASLYHEELTAAARGRRVNNAKVDELFSEPAVETGATTYRNETDISKEHLSEDDKAVLAKWGMSPQEWQDIKKKYG